MSPQVVNDVVTCYIHIAALAWRGLRNGTLEQEKGCRILLDCKNGLEKYGYRFYVLAREAGVGAYKA